MNSSRFLKKLFTLGLSASTAVFASSYVLNLDSPQDDSASAPEALVTGTGSAFGTSITVPFVFDHRQSGFLDADGYLWYAGSNAYGSAGTGDANLSSALTSYTKMYKNGSAVDNSASNPTKANETGYFTDIIDYAIYEHTVIIDSDGAVWTAGGAYTGHSGQLGRGDTTNKSTHGVSNITSGAAKVAAGNAQTLVQMADGSVMAAGAKAYIGLGSSGSQTTFVETIDRFTTEEKRGIVDMSCGLTAAYVLFGDGDLWTSSGGSWELMASNIKMFDCDSAGGYIYAVTTANVIMYALTSATSFTNMPTQPTEEVMQIRGGGTGYYSQSGNTRYVWGYLTTSGDLYLSGNASTTNAPIATATHQTWAGKVSYFDLAGSTGGGTTNTLTYAYLTSDDDFVRWGGNDNGQLGNGSSGSNVSVAYTSRITVGNFTNGENVDINGGIVNTPPYAPEKRPSEAVYYKTK